jgi:predicted dehydrogenase
MVAGMAKLNQKKVYNFAILGTGYMAQEYVNVVKSLKIKKSISVLGSSYSKTNSFKKKNNLDYAAKSIKDLNKKFDANYLIICVREEKLFGLIDKIIEFNWKCLCEKPLGYSYDQTKKIVKRLNIKKINNFFIGLNRRNYFSTNKAIDLIVKSNLKTQRVIEIIDQEDLKYQKKIGTAKKVINNFMYANSIHLVDYTNLFCRGSIKKITTIEPHQKNKPHIMSKIIYFSSGDICLYKCYWDMEARWSVNFLQGNLSIKLKPLEKIFANKKINNKLHDKLKKWDSDFKPGLKFQVLNFLENDHNFLLNPSEYLSLVERIKKIFF